MTILVIDGQGGNMGALLVKMISARFADAELLAVGTNSTATANMLKNGAGAAATGENAVIVACRRADIIIGPMGIVLADSLLGEVTPAMAAAVGASAATRVLLPVNRCRTLIAGLPELPVSALLEDAASKIAAAIAERT